MTTLTIEGDVVPEVSGQGAKGAGGGARCPLGADESVPVEALTEAVAVAGFTAKVESG